MFSIHYHRSPSSSSQLPIGAKWRSSTWYITFAIGLGIFAAQLLFSLLVPVLPFRMEALGFADPSTRTGWMNTTAGLVTFFTSPVAAYIFHRNAYRRGPLIGAGVITILATFLFMFARPYWCLLVCRAVAGAAQGVFLTVGLAVIVENVPEDIVGRQIGYAMSGMFTAQSFGPALGGALYARVGWNGPFILGISVMAADIGGRLLLLEKQDLVRFTDRDVENASTRASLAIMDQESSELAKGDGLTNPDLITAPTILGQTLDTVTVSLNPDGHAVKQLSPWRVLYMLLSMPRAATALLVVWAASLAYNMTDTTISLRVAEIWHKETWFIGLMYLGIAGLTPLPGPVTGWMADRWGAQIIVPALLFCMIPWAPLMLLHKSLAGFIISFASWNVLRCGFMRPLGQDLNKVASKKESGFSRIHAMGAFGSASALGVIIGPVLSGHLYDQGRWNIVCWLIMGIMVAPLPFVLLFTGDKPMIGRLLLRSGRQEQMERETAKEVADISA